MITGPPVHLGRIAEHPPVGVDNEGHTTGQEHPAVDPRRNPSRQDHRPHQRDAAWNCHVACGVRRVIQQFVQHRRRQSNRRQQHEAEREIHDGGKNEIAIPEQRLVEEMSFGGQDVHDKQVETGHRGSRFCPDFGGVEPLQALAAVQQHLQPDRAERECRQAEEIEGRVLPGPRLRKQQRHGQEDESRHRQADIEHRAPAMIFTEPAADAGTAEEAKQHGYSRHQVYAGMARGRQNIEQDRQRQRNEGAACATLDNAGGDELQRGRRARRQHKADRKEATELR